MKTLKKIFTVTILLSFLLYIGCKEGDDPIIELDPLEEQLEALMNGGSSWSISSVTKDGYDVTDQFTGFVLTIAEFTYSTQNGLATAWPTSGTWEFHNNTSTAVMRDGDTLIQVGLSGNQLTLSYAVTGLSSGGRTEGVDGDYVFLLTSQ